jgi:hypothetical protein
MPVYTIDYDEGSVFKVVNGRDLEKAMREGWKLHYMIGCSSTFGPFPVTEMQFLMVQDEKSALAVAAAERETLFKEIELQKKQTETFRNETKALAGKIRNISMQIELGHSASKVVKQEIDFAVKSLVGITALK